MARADFLAKAENTISSRLADVRRTFDNHIHEVSEKIPEFSEVDLELQKAGQKILFSSFLGVEAIDEVRSEYEKLVSRKKDLLISNGYPEDYCDYKYYCNECNDTGYVGAKRCKCLKKEINMEILKESGLYTLAQKQTFDNFSLDYYQNNDKIAMENNVEFLKEYAEEFKPGSSSNIILLGPTGLGKTHLSTATAITVINKGFYTIYETAFKLFDNYQNRRFSYDSDSPIDLDKYYDCDLLIIDDLGTEFISSYTVSCLYDLINKRINMNKSTIINTNLDADQLLKTYNDRIFSRLFGEFKVLLFSGTDIREQKIKNNID